MTPRLFRTIAATEARKSLSYRVDFWLQAVAIVAVEGGIAWFVWAAVFAESRAVRIGGLTLGGTVVYAIAAVLVGKLVRGREFEATVSEDVYEGGLSRYLLYPVPYFWMKYAQHVGALLPAAIQCVLLAALLPVLFGGAATGISFASVALALPAIVIANVLYYLMAFPVQGISFWADNVWSLSNALRIVCAILGGSMIPLAMFPSWASEALAWTPFPHLYAWPVSTLLGRVSAADALVHGFQAVAWCVAFRLVGAGVFHRGRLRYTGVGI